MCVCVCRGGSNCPRIISVRHMVPVPVLIHTSLLGAKDFKTEGDGGNLGFEGQGGAVTVTVYPHHPTDDVLVCELRGYGPTVVCGYPTLTQAIVDVRERYGRGIPAEECAMCL